MKKLFLSLIGISVAAIAVNAAPLPDPLRNPALNPVQPLPNSAHATLRMVENNVCRAAIVANTAAEAGQIPERRSVQKAVNTLQEAFKRCFNVELPLLAPDASPQQLAAYSYLIIVGDNKLTRQHGVDTGKLAKEAFVVKTFPGGVIIAGHDGSTIPGTYDAADWSRLRINGTHFGALDFVERFLGVRYYYPNEGTIFPSRTKLLIATAAYTDKPVFPNRFTHCIAVAMRPQNHYKEIGPYEKADWEGRYRMALSTRYWAGHGPSPDLLAAAHPDKMDEIFYTDPAGHRYFTAQQNTGNYLDVSNLALADLIVADLERYYRSSGRDNQLWKRGVTPNKDYIFFGQCDTLVNNMDTPVIRRLGLIPPQRRGSTDGELSDVYSRFHIYLAEQITQKFPGKRLSIMPYHNYVLPPAKKEFRKFPSTIDVRTCIYDFPKYIPNKATVARWNKLHAEWRQVLGGRAVGSMWLYNEPRLAFGRAIVGRYTGDIPRVMGKNFGRTELFFDYFGDHDWEYFYTYYLVWRGMWNPEFNKDAALHEMWRLLYGDAAPLVKEFYDTLRDRWENVMAQNNDRKKAYNPTVINKLEKLLQQMASAVPPDSLAAKRLQLFMKPWPRAIKEARGVLAFSKPQYKVVKLSPDSKITIDGMDNEKEWQTSRVMTLPDAAGSGDTMRRPVTGKLLWSENGLYGFFRFSTAPARAANDNLWDNDHLEIFLSPGLKMNEYFQLAAGVTGKQYTGQKTLKPVETPYDINWRGSGFSHAQRRTADGWDLEFFIPWQAMRMTPPRDYSSLFGNFIGNRTGGAHAESGSFSMTLGNNHNIEQFGFIKFLGKGDK